MQRWRKPPIFALAYISPARSSKRRMRSIFSRAVRQVSLSGRLCSPAPQPLASRPATSLGLSRSAPPPWPVSRCGAPSPDCVASLVAMCPESTHPLPRSIDNSPGWGEGSLSLASRANRPPLRLPSHAATPTPTPTAAPTATCSALCFGALTNRTHMRLRRGQGGSGVFEAIVAVEELVADRDRGHASYAPVVRLGGDLPKLVLDRLGLDGLQDGVRMQLAGGRRDQDVVDIREITPAGKRLAKRGKRERDRAPNRLSEDSSPHR